MQTKPQEQSSWHTVWLGVGLALVVLSLAGAFVVHRLRHRIPAELMQDIRAGVAARHLKDPDLRFQKYLEGRYGSLTDPAIREKVFLDFFNVEHIRAMQFLVKHSPPAMRQANIDASARWIKQFRESLSPEQQAQLIAHLQAGGGNSLLAQATAQYNTQDVHYRGQTVPVISELLKTIAQSQSH